MKRLAAFILQGNRAVPHSLPPAPATIPLSVSIGTPQGFHHGCPFFPDAGAYSNIHHF